MLENVRIYDVVAKLNDVNIRYAEGIEFGGDFMAVYTPELDEVCIALGRSAFDLMDTNPKKVYAFLCHEYQHIKLGHIDPKKPGVMINQQAEIEADQLPASIVGGKVYAEYISAFHKAHMEEVFQSSVSFVEKIKQGCLAWAIGFIRCRAALRVKLNMSCNRPAFTWCDNALNSFQAQGLKPPTIG